MGKEKYKQILHKLLKLTSGLIEGPNTRTTNFQKVLEGIARKNYFKLYAISYLSDNDFTGDAILDLSRSMLEDMIAVEFMKLKGKEKMAYKFVKYMNVESKKDLDFLIENGSHPDENLFRAAEAEFKKVERYFLYKGQIARTWSMCDTEHMINELLKTGVIKDFDKNMLLQAYIMGNRKNHLSPTDILSFMIQDYRNISQSESANIGIVFALICYLKIIIEFAEEMKQQIIATDLEDIWHDLNTKINNSKRKSV